VNPNFVSQRGFSAFLSSTDFPVLCFLSQRLDLRSYAGVLLHWSFFYALLFPPKVFPFKDLINYPFPVAIGAS